MCPSFVANKVKYSDLLVTGMTVQYLQCLVHVIPYEDSSIVHFMMDIKRLEPLDKGSVS